MLRTSAKINITQEEKSTLVHLNMRILSQEKKYLYYCMIGQLHEDGYTQQALQLEACTLYTSQSVKASDKLNRLFSSCIASVNEANSYFNNSNMRLAMKRRPPHLTSANIKAASLSNLAKRRRTAGSIDSASMLQDSIKKCVKLVTNDLQKVGPSDLNVTPNKNLASFPPVTIANTTSSTPRVAPKPRSSIGAVSNAFLKGISLLNSSTSLPKVTPISSTNTLAVPPNKTIGSPNLKESVVKLTKSTRSDTAIIDVESGSLSRQVAGPSHSTPSFHQRLATPSIPAKALAVNINKATALKSLVRNLPLSKVLNKASATNKTTAEVIVLDNDPVPLDPPPLLSQPILVTLPVSDSPSVITLPEATESSVSQTPDDPPGGTHTQESTRESPTPEPPAEASPATTSLPEASPKTTSSLPEPSPTTTEASPPSPQDRGEEPPAVFFSTSANVDDVTNTLNLRPSLAHPDSSDDSHNPFRNTEDAFPQEIFAAPETSEVKVEIKTESCSCEKSSCKVEPGTDCSEDQSDPNLAQAPVPSEGTTTVVPPDGEQSEEAASNRDTEDSNKTCDENKSQEADNAQETDQDDRRSPLKDFPEDGNDQDKLRVSLTDAILAATDTLLQQ